MADQSEEKIYKIGQAAKLVGLKSYVLRFWEGEFSQLRPIRTDSGQRLYNEKHIALIQRIKDLLHDEGMTIEGARKRLEGSEEPDVKLGDDISTSSIQLFSQIPEGMPQCADKSILREIHEDLLEIKKLLEK